MSPSIFFLTDVFGKPSSVEAENIGKLLLIFLLVLCRGYMAPEYVVRGKLTEKADVYSFGVLVIEVVSGRRTNAFSQDSCSILQMVILLCVCYYIQHNAVTCY